MDFDREKSKKWIAKYLGMFEDAARASGDDDIADFLQQLCKKLGSCGMLLPDGKTCRSCSEAHMCYRCAAIQAHKWALETNKRMMQVLARNLSAEPFKVTLSLRSATESELASVIIELIDRARDFLKREGLGAAWALHVNREGNKYFPHIHALVIVDSPDKAWPIEFLRNWRAFSGATSKRQYAERLQMESRLVMDGGRELAVVGAYYYLRYFGRRRNGKKRRLHPEHIYSIWLAHCEVSNTRGLKRMHRTRGRTGLLYGANR